jgi:hypothetical protein
MLAEDETRRTSLPPSKVTAMRLDGKRGAFFWQQVIRASDGTLSIPT